jgi:hypothetical protein
MKFMVGLYITYSEITKSITYVVIKLKHTSQTQNTSFRHVTDDKNFVYLLEYAGVLSK